MKIGIVGLGLIGGSMAKAFRRVSPDMKILAYNRSRESLVEALADGVKTDEAVKNGRLNDRLGVEVLIIRCSGISGRKTEIKKK